MEALEQHAGISSQLTDQEVVARVIAGQKGLYEILMRRYNQRLYRAVRSYLTDPDDVQDALQDTYVKAYEKLFQFRQEAAFSTWLTRIAINEALQCLKRSRTARLHIVPAPTPERLAQLPDTDTMDPEQRTLHHERTALLERAIDRLPAAYRVVYLLREVEGLSVAEAAEALQLSESNVKVRLHRAKALLKDALFELHAGAEVFTFGQAHCDRLVAAVLDRLG